MTFLAEKVARRLEETAISTRTNEAVGYMKKAFKDFDVFHVQIRPEKHYSTMDITIEEADGYKMTHETRQKDAKKKNSVNPAVVTGDRPTVSITLPISTERNYRYEVTISRDRKKILISETEYRLAEALSGADRAIDYNQKCAKNVNRERVKASVDDFVEHVIEVVYHCISWKGDKKNIVVEHDEIDETDYNMELDQLEDGKKSRK